MIQTKSKQIHQSREIKNNHEVRDLKIWTFQPMIDYQPWICKSRLCHIYIFLWIKFIPQFFWHTDILEGVIEVKILRYFILPVVLQAQSILQFGQSLISNRHRDHISK